MTDFRMQKCVYFRRDVLEKSKEKAQNEDLSFSNFINKAVKFYLEHQKNVDANNTCLP